MDINGGIQLRTEDGLTLKLRRILIISSERIKLSEDGLTLNGDGLTLPVRIDDAIDITNQNQ